MKKKKEVVVEDDDDDGSVRALITAIAQRQEFQFMELKKLIVNLKTMTPSVVVVDDHQQRSSDSDSEEEERIMDIPIAIDGPEDPDQWIYQNEEFFKVKGTAVPDNKVELAAIHMEGEALAKPKVDTEIIRPTSSAPAWKYDVFVSFRGDDTRRGFASHLFHALRSADINCYRDIDRDSRGQVVGPMLIDAIHHSMMAIVLFSKNYADSKWCLQELVEILSCNNQYRAFGYTVLPIFYDVEPSEVRNQSGKVGEAFKRCRAKNREQEEAWRNALEEAGNVSSWHLTNDANGYNQYTTQQFPTQIVEELLRRVFFSRSPYFVETAIGTNDNVNHVIALLGSGRDNIIRSVGIYGAQGIGKTALAKITCSRLYNEFEGSVSLLENIHDNASTKEGLLLLQSKLVKDVLKIKRASLSDNRSRNIGEIRKRLYQKKVLIVLDNLVKPQEMVSIFGRDPDRFLDPGSRILITTRKKQLLDELNVGGIYMVPPLRHQDSLKLFYHHALVEDEYTTGYEELSKNLVHYTGGLPLALQTLASFLSDKPKDEWHRILQKLVRNPRLDSIGVRSGSVSPLYNHRTVGPEGGSGVLFDDGTHTGVTKIKITVSSNKLVILSLTIEYVSNGSTISSCAHGGYLNPDKGTSQWVTLDYPDEYLTSITGTITEKVNFGAVQSITFHSNKRSYGAFGTEQGTAFTFPQIDGGNIIGFFGHCDTYFVDSIGAYFGPIIDPSPFITSGPFGSIIESSAWDDGKHLDVRQIDVAVVDSVIKSIRVTYDNYGHPLGPFTHGSTNVNYIAAQQVIKLKYPYEYLTAISGYMGETETSGVHSLTLHSNKRKYGPFGDENGRHFSTQPSGTKIVGFFGAGDSELQSIGVHLEPVSHIHPRKIIGPFGSNEKHGTHDDVWVHGDDDHIKNIVVTLGDDGVVSVRWEYVDKNGNHMEGSTDHGEGRSGQLRSFKQVEVKLNYPIEYINSMSGCYEESNGVTILKRVTFQSNLATHGPYGFETRRGTCFKTPWNIGKVVGFYGRNSSIGYLASIGAYFAPVYHVIPLTTIGPFGDYFHETWDDGKHNGVKKISLQYGSVIDSINFVYVDGDGHTVVEGKLHGTRSRAAQVFELDYPNEYLVAMSGYIGLLGHFTCIRSLSFETNRKRKFGPYGSQEGKYFSFKSNIAKIVGFHGSINFWYLNSIGPYLQLM